MMMMMMMAKTTMMMSMKETIRMIMNGVDCAGLKKHCSWSQNYWGTPVLETGRKLTLCFFL
jgi:hypothetical protein